MKRREFLLASGSTILTGAALSSFQRPALGLEFELSAIPDEKPVNVDSILVEFTNFEITPSYLDESNGLDITVDLDIEEESTVTKSVTGLSFANDQTIDQAEIQSKTGKIFHKLLLTS